MSPRDNKKSLNFNISLQNDRGKFECRHIIIIKYHIYIALKNETNGVIIISNLS